MRYEPLVDVLNAILSWASKDKAEVIFVVNDPAIVYSPELEHSSKRKPDIILISLATFRKWYGFTNATFTQCRTLNTKELGEDVIRTWSDVIQFWELKLQDSTAVLDLLKGYTDEGMSKFTRSLSTSGQYYPSFGNSC